MKLKVVVLACSASVLTACGIAYLWKNTIADTAASGVPLAIVADSSNNSYQLYNAGSSLQLRKLDATGLSMWATPVDATLGDSTGPSALKLTSSGVVVGYGTGTTQAFVKAFNADGSTEWSSDLGAHTAEAIDAMLVAPDDSVTVSIKLAAGKANMIRLDSTGAVVWDKAMPTCTFGLYCVSALAMNDSGQVLESLAEITMTKSYLIDSTGATLWANTHATGVSTAGVAANPITATPTGFVVTHPLTTWEYNAVGAVVWSAAFGSNTNVARDGSGNYYVANGGKISKLDATGMVLSEIPLAGQFVVNQVEWREDLQRLMVLSQHSTQDLSVAGVITLKNGPSAWVFDNAGTQIAKFDGAVPMKITGNACDPFPTCATVTVTQGDQWSNFATTLNKMIVISGLVNSKERYAVAYTIN